MSAPRLTALGRAAEFGGKSWFYLVNTANATMDVRLTVLPGTVDLVTGRRLSGPVELNLLPYEFLSFRAPKGAPKVQVKEKAK